MQSVTLIPKTVTYNQTELRFKVVSTDVVTGNCSILYQLFSDKGKLIEQGNKTIPINVVASISGTPLDIAAANTALETFGIQADPNQPVVTKTTGFRRPSVSAPAPSN